MAVQLALLFATFLSLLVVVPRFASASPLSMAAERYPRRTDNGLHLPIFRREPPPGIVRRAGQVGVSGLGNYVDVTYSVLATMGGVDTPLVLDTGSSDLWVVSDACKNCPSTVPLFPQTSFSSNGPDVQLLYGDSRTGTHAFGLVGTSNVSFAGLTVPNQYFAAINDTTTNVLEKGCAGIFGLGFALNSVIWNQVFTDQFFASESSASRRTLSGSNYATRFFPSFTDLAPKKVSSAKKVSSSDLTSAVLQSYSSQGPAITRLVTNHDLASPMFAVTLQRNTVDIGGNAGLLSIGELPAGVDKDGLTWASVRRYPGKLNAPNDSPNEVYPIAWELFVDDVYLDGVRIPRSNLSSASIALSALVDTGNSLLRGPKDVVAAINKQLLGATSTQTFACATPHTLAFQIAGKMFPVDPRDFVTQAYNNQVDDCISNVVETDAPMEDEGYQYSWSLGDPFLKGVLAAFYYGNITYPSHDPPRIGLLSTVPDDAGTQLQTALKKAVDENGGNIFTTSQAAPTGVPSPAGVGPDGVPTASAGVGKLGSGSSSLDAPLRGCVLVVLLVGGLFVGQM
ncbi:aspartic peptidase domain-containing protein [Mycena rebaudengoi]|nr:aspartic peptidase domain-containing protein [Mycena rebaudengoi]